MTDTKHVYNSVLKYLQITFFTVILLYFGKTLFIPLFLGLLVAMVLYPVCRWLEQHKWPKSLAITACLLIVSILIAALLALFAWQISELREDLPGLIQKFREQMPLLREWLSENMGISIGIQDSWINKMTDNAGAMISGTISSTVNTLFTFFIVPVFTALFLYHRRLFVQFLQLTVGGKYQPQLNRILQQTIFTYFNFIKGMIKVYLIVGVLNSAGLLALGIENAILFGLLCALMTIIPYIGIIISALLPISVAWLSTNSLWYPLGVVAVFSIVQYLEANVIFPRVVGTQLNVSTWATLVAIIAGGILWGVSGMILFIPFLAILKIITDNVEEWKPLNLLLGRSDD